MGVKALPYGARKIAHYWYSDGNELALFMKDRKLYVRNPETWDYPISPCRGCPAPHPYEGLEVSNTSYETMGMYYKYEMLDTGLHGDC